MTTVHLKLKDGGPAFPRPFSWDESPVKGMHSGDRPEDHNAQQGMSLRDYFAAAALTGLLARPREIPMLAEGAAEAAYRYADAMLEERVK